MNKTKKHLLNIILVTCILLSITLAVPGLIESKHGKGGTALAASSDGFTSYLPLVLRGHPATTIFGVELYQITSAGGLNNMQNAGTTWIRRNGLSWAAVEPTPGARNWSAVASLEGELKSASSRGMKVILIVRSTPAWASVNPAYPCGPIQQSYFQAFGEFLRDAVDRYSAPPFSVKYWEIYNEPDVPLKKDDFFGCWGDPSEKYYGGEYYGQMLKVIYPYMKQANPDANVLVGGLLLDCDPTTVCTDAPKNAPPKFLRGILEVGAGNSFDGVSFHAYDYYLGVQGQYRNVNWASLWNTTGPVVTAKANYINNLLSIYGATGKFLMNTESAVLWDGTCETDCQETKASYLAQTFAVAKALGLRANVWYSYYGWRNSGLVTDGQLAPAYYAYDFAQDILGTAVYVREVSLGSGEKIYEFQQSNGRLTWFVWSLDGADHVVTLPDTPESIRNIYGDNQTVNGTTLTVTLSPLYIDFAP